MSWKNLAQTSLSDALVRHHEKLEELGGYPSADRLAGNGKVAVGHT